MFPAVMKQSSIKGVFHVRIALSLNLLLLSQATLMTLKSLTTNYIINAFLFLLFFYYYRYYYYLMKQKYFARPNSGIEYVPLGSSDLSSPSSLISSGNINGFKVSPGFRIWFNDGNSIQSVCSSFSFHLSFSFIYSFLFLFLTLNAD